MSEEMPQLRVKREAKRVQGFVEKLNGVPLDMILIPSGSFLMGSPSDEEDSYEDEIPQHQVTVPMFFMGRYPITPAQWKAVAAMPQIKKELDSKPSRYTQKTVSER
ncbi:MAG: formylglycine-generating enzyme family protein [Crocosphaera sp.]